ncbi:MAG: hypothetical protein P1V97_03025 [Planctomycetota bacterium]|nr:hypothetical protein [Planctomycetota bacterium]
MGDSRLSKLKRRWKLTGDIADYVLYQGERLRIGEIKGYADGRLGGPALALDALYQEADGVLDFGLFESRSDASVDDHRQEIFQLFEVLREEWSRSSSAFEMRIDRRDFSGERISLREFLGWHYDSEQDCLVLRSRNSAHLNEYFTRPYLINATCLTDYSILEDQWDARLEIGEGFAYALSNPPYNMRYSDPCEFNTLFQGLCFALFGGLSEELIIYRWDTNWSNYFDAGREWWGTFLWTIQRPGSSSISVIAGSTTD